MKTEAPQLDVVARSHATERRQELKGVPVASGTVPLVSDEAVIAEQMRDGIEDVSGEGSKVRHAVAFGVSEAPNCQRRTGRPPSPIAWPSRAQAFPFGNSSQMTRNGDRLPTYEGLGNQARSLAKWGVSTWPMIRCWPATVRQSKKKAPRIAP